MTLIRFSQFAASLMLLAVATLAQAERIKDISSIAGVRENELIGYGLVVGLNGTGDTKTPFSEQSLKSMLAKFGINMAADTQTNSKNIAAVAVTAKLPPFAKPGQKVDVTISSLGNAKSLKGGQLLLTPLKGADGNTYALAQGTLLVGGLDDTNTDGSRITVNNPSNGRIPNGGSIERALQTGFDQGNSIFLQVHQEDFTTTTRMVKAINDLLGEGVAYAQDGSSVRVRAPMDPNQRVAFISVLENIQVDPAKAPAKIIVNAKTGTVVISEDVRVSPAAVTHGGLSLNIKATGELDFGQPNRPSNSTSTDPNVPPQGRMFALDQGVSLNEIVKAINKVGAAPSDIVAILESLKQLGALHADLIIL